MKNRCQLNLQLRNPFGKPVSRKAAQWTEDLEFWEDLERSQYMGHTWETGNTQTSPKTPLGILAVLGDLERSEYSDYYQCSEYLEHWEDWEHSEYSEGLEHSEYSEDHFRRTSPNPESARCALNGRRPHGRSSESLLHQKRCSQAETK